MIHFKFKIFMTDVLLNWKQIEINKFERENGLLGDSNRQASTSQRKHESLDDNSRHETCK